MRQQLHPHLPDIERSPSRLAKVDAALAELDMLPGTDTVQELVFSAPANTNRVPKAVVTAVRAPEASLVLELLCGALDVELWTTQLAIALLAWPTLFRAAVFQQVLSETGLGGSAHPV